MIIAGSMTTKINPAQGRACLRRKGGVFPLKAKDEPGDAEINEEPRDIGDGHQRRAANMRGIRAERSGHKGQNRAQGSSIRSLGSERAMPIARPMSMIVIEPGIWKAAEVSMT